MDAIVTRLIACLLLMCCTGNLQARELPDPTRPATAALGNGAGAGTAAAPEQLQSVLIGRSGRRVAIISGQMLRVGDKLGGAILIGISENSVLLKNGRKQHVLTLFPAPLERSLSAVPGAEQ
jgi:MSHA biogenesis protein MshK